ncbi:hypothetical protein [Streptococcus mitis]|nr:hypothetical protein [Streptococcus mitis]DAN62015.1 MAG TPA: hypothetical protein [Caudoviricetes sp.]DAQ10832.1 MAG TPA: hypothetical protein [Caudoviricetes sp.]
MNEIEGGARTLNVLYDTLISGTSLSILDTTILTDFRLHAHSL